MKEGGFTRFATPTMMRWWGLAFVCSMGCALLLMSLSSGAAVRFVRDWAYLATFPILLGWGVLLAIQLRVRLKRRTLSWRSAAIPLSTVGLGACVLFTHADFGPKILMDEYILASTARNIHEYGDISATTRVAPVGEDYRPSETFVDKRPWAFPLLVSLAHDFFSYNADHGFWVNGFLGVTVLALAYGLGVQIGGRGAGVTAVLLWASLPLLAQSATGGGMGVLNICLIQGLLLIAVRYLSDSSEINEILLVTTAVLLAYTRYESILFLGPAAVVVIIGFLKSSRKRPAWVTGILPLLLLPLLLHLKAQAGNPEGYEIVGDPEQPFSLGHLVRHFPNALAYLFNFDHGLSNSIWLSTAGSIGLVGVAVGIPRLRNVYLDRPERSVWVIFLPFLVLHLVLMLAYHAGRLDSLFASRFALPFHVALVGGTLLLVADHLKDFAYRWHWAAGLSVVAIVAFTIPMNAKAIFSEKSFAVNEQEWLEELREAHLVPDSLIIDRFTLPWSLAEWVALRPEDAIKGRKVVRSNVLSGVHAGAYVVERNIYHEGAFTPENSESDLIRELFETEVIAERSFRPLTMTRVYRIRFSEKEE